MWVTSNYIPNIWSLGYTELAAEAELMTIETTTKQTINSLMTNLIIINILLLILKSMTALCTNP